ncbi:diacylglycerol/lipid kinase family protein [Actinomadura sp. 1N219]|uniref:diacylglycerol/lipid kinase family protein n=1 Tax=Actinomadura sp. 1N219 TaxID=3375152 RepID=UPI00379687DD
MPDTFGSRLSGRPRTAARLCLLFAAAAVTTLLLSAGLRALTLPVIGAAGLAVTAAALWWALTRRGAARVAALVLAVGAPGAVLARYVAVGLLWAVLATLALWALAVLCGRAALRAAVPAVAEHSAPPPQRPFLIMNPRSGGGKVGRFGLCERARELGAEVVVLDPGRPADVAAMARRAVARGADLLGVAGGDGTQARVAGVAAMYNVPFMVIPAGTRNHFALDLGLDRADPALSLDALTDTGVELRVDLGLVGERVFVNNASFGAYAAVVQSPEYRDGKLRTTVEMLPDLLTHHRGPRLIVQAGPAVIEGPQAVLVSNNPYQGGDPAGMGRREQLDSGVLGVLGVTVDSAGQAAVMLRGRRGGLISLTAREVVVEADAPEISVGVDGEAVTLAAPVTCVIRPGALRVRVPRDRRAPPPAKPPLDWRALGRLAFTRGGAPHAERGAAGPRRRPDDRLDQEECTGDDR